MSLHDDWGTNEWLAVGTVVFLLASIFSIKYQAVPGEWFPILALVGIGLLGLLALLNLASGDPWDVLWGGSVFALAGALWFEQVPFWVTYAALGAIALVAIRERVAFVKGVTSR